MSESLFKTKQKVAFSLAFLPGWLIQGIFTIWVFTFYFSAVGLPIQYIMIAYASWSVWNAINDPLIGYLSDRTRTRWGRRKPYLAIGIIPSLIIIVVVWTPPIQDPISGFIYLLLMLICFDTFFTMIAVPLDCLFPELYTLEKDRAQVNTYRQIFSIIGIIAAFLIPGVLIGEISVKEGYLYSGIVVAIIGAVTFLIFMKWGVKEREEFKFDSHYDFGFFQGLKYTIKNRAFVLYSIMLVGFEYIQLLQATIMPQFTKFVLGQEGTMESSILLGLNQIIAIITIIVWKKVGIKIGNRLGYFVAVCILFVASIPMIFIVDYASALVAVTFAGLGFGGMLFFTTLLSADIIDQDELKTSVRREGSFYGITNFFMRLTGILSIITISLVFTSAGWEEYTPNPGVNVILGLRWLMAIFPMISMGVIILCIYLYPITKTRTMEMKKVLIELHQKKRDRLSKGA